MGISVPTWYRHSTYATLRSTKNPNTPEHRRHMQKEATGPTNSIVPSQRHTANHCAPAFP